ncbi:MAG: hypothetical protein WAN65_23895 [Candidatus Sulfotelmatobacter sp.]
MIYILRLTNGDCVVAMAADESGARRVAMSITTLGAAPEIASIRRLDTFGVRFSPTEDGSLEVTHWDDETLDSILANEYPLLNEACQRANAEPFLPAANLAEPVLSQLKDAYERNTDIIRQGLQEELQRYAQPNAAIKTKAAATRR